MNPIATLLGAIGAYAALVFVLAATAFGFAWQYYEAVLKEAGQDRERLTTRLAGRGGRVPFISVK